MTHWQRYLYVNTRSKGFLWLLCLGILSLGVTASIIYRFFQPDPTLHSLIRPMPEVKASEWTDKEFADLLNRVLLYLSTPIYREKLDDFLNARDLTPSSRQIIAAYLQSIERNQAEPSPKLKAFAEKTPPVRFANLAIARLIQKRAPQQAAQAYEKEGKFPNAEFSRKNAIKRYLIAKDTEAVRRLSRDPLYASLFTMGIRFSQARIEQNYLGILLLALPSLFSEVSVSVLFLAGVTLTMLFLFCYQALFPQKFISQPLFGAMLSIVLGFSSVAVTDMVNVYLEAFKPDAIHTDLVGGVLYYTLFVGLKEEAIKLLLFIPLTPWVLRRGNPLEMLMFGGCVGLGFAAAENIQYYALSGSSAAPVRFVTANFFHIAATALCALSFCRLFTQGLTQFLNLFFPVVIMHGLYDSFLAVPALSQYSMVSTVILVLLCYQFFHELRSLRPNRSETVSLTANFVVGLAIVSSLTLFYIAKDYGVSDALNLLFPEALGLSIIIYTFIREMPESLMR